METEFDVGDYEAARDLAKKIKDNAQRVNAIFNKMTSTMNKLAEDWQGEGSRQVQDMYGEIKAQYPAFYNRMNADTDHILSVVATDEEAEDAATAVVQNAG